MKFKRNFIVCFAIFVIIILFIKYSSMILIIQPISDNVGDKKFGIIDGNLNASHSNIISSNKINKRSEITHGDKILEFMQSCTPQCLFYYYDAEKKEGISSDSILEGLNWMIENDVDCVSISMSSKFYSSELEEWIENNADKIVIYASYNNKSNSLDYPARYKYVKGVCSTLKTKNKDIDIIFKSHNIMLISNGVQFYNGNSYLSPYAMVIDNIKKNEEK